MIGASFLAAPLVGAPPMRSGGKARRAMTLAVATHDPGGRVIVDVGAGWGDLVLHLAEAFPNRRVIGYEISPVPWFAARIRTLLSGRRNAEIRLGNGFHAIETGRVMPDTLVCYLSGLSVSHLKRCLGAHPALLVANTFPIPGWTPLSTEQLPDLLHSTIYVYGRGARPVPAATP